MHDHRIQALEHALAGHRARTATPRPGAMAASVALLLRPEPADLELLLIQRAVRAGDPWSGHMALPGGRRDPGDASGLETAIRETAEEVGIDLSARGARIGRLDDVQPRSGAPPVAVSPYVFAVPSGTHAVINAEVALALWVPLQTLLAPGAATEYLHALGDGQHLRFPAIGYQDHVIWGLTHRILAQFLEFARSVSHQGGAR